MFTSKNYYELARNLYFYRVQASNILKSRTYTVGKTMKAVVKQPLVFGKKAAVMAIKDPKRLYGIASGKRAIQNNKKIQEELIYEYQKWLEQTKLTASEINSQRTQSAKFKTQPLVSLITPVFDPPYDAHKKLIDSVLNQTYENLELLLYNFGTEPDIQELLAEYEKKDKRVIVKQGMPNQGIGANSNLCLQDVKGEFVALLDHDDALTENALFECVSALNETDTDFIYTDKDKISEEDVRSEPLFKPDWSPEMALGGNYMTHLNLMRTGLVRKLGGWDPKTDGAQDWDLFLRIISASKKPIVHVPKIVYHWRTVKTSTAGGNSAKPYVIAAQQLAVQKYLDSLGVTQAVPRHDIHGQMNLHWRTAAEPSFLIHIQYQDIGNVISLLETNSLRRSQSVFVFVRKNTLSELEKKKLAKFPNIVVEEYETGSFVSAVLRRIGTFHSSVVYCTDSIKAVDNINSENSWFTQLCGWLQIPGVAIAGGGTYAENGQIVDIGSYFDSGSKKFSKYYFGAGLRSGYNGHSQWIRNHILVSERLFAFKTKLLDELEGLSDLRDDEFAKALSLIAYSKGQRAVFDPLVYATDCAGFEIRAELSLALDDFVINNCSQLLNADPYYNKNLAATYVDPKPRLSDTGLKIDSVFIRSIEGIN